MVIVCDGAMVGSGLDGDQWSLYAMVGSGLDGDQWSLYAMVGSGLGRPCRRSNS